MRCQCAKKNMRLHTFVVAINEWNSILEFLAFVFSTLNSPPKSPYAFLFSHILSNVNVATFAYLHGITIFLMLPKME